MIEIEPGLSVDPEEVVALVHHPRGFAQESALTAIHLRGVEKPLTTPVPYADVVAQVTAANRKPDARTLGYG